MTLVLQQTLRGLCYDTGWCYAVFWKLKRQIRTVLTWEDGFYQQLKSPAIPKLSSESAAVKASLSPGLFSQQVNGGLENLEDGIGLAVAKMSYHVYSVGEGIIGRVAFTNKHQWIFGESDKAVSTEGGDSSKQNFRSTTEKGNLQYPAGWQNQFAAGIKTIAVIAVPQGVVQLGSTQTIAEDLNLVGHVKSVFGTLQNVPGAFLSDFVSEVQRGKVHGLNPMAMSAPPMTAMGPPSTNAAFQELTRMPAVPAGLGSVATGLGAIVSDHFGHCGVGRLPMLMASQKLHPQAQPSFSGVIGVQESPIALQQSLLHKLGSKVLVQPSFTASKFTGTRAGPTNGDPLKADFQRTGIIECFALTNKPTTKSPNISVTVSGSSNIPPFGEKSHSGTSSAPLQSIAASSIENSQPVVLNASSIAGSSTRLGNGAEDVATQVEVQSQNNVSICFVKNESSKRDSLVFDSAISTISEESLQPSAMRSIGYNVARPKLSYDDSQCQSQACEPSGDLGIAVTPWLHNSQSCLETNNTCDNTWNTDNSQINLQISDLLQLSERFEDADKIDYGEEKDCLYPKETAGVLCEDGVEDMQPLFEKSGLCLRDLPGNLDTQNASNSELQEFDDFIALLSKEQNKQGDCLSTLGAGFATGDELSEALFPMFKKTTSKSCFQDPTLKRILDTPNIQEVGASIAKEGYKANESSEFSVSFRTALQSGVKPEPLLEAVVASVSNIKPKPIGCDNGASCKTGLLSPPSFSLEVWRKSSGGTVAGQALADGRCVTKLPGVFSPILNKEEVTLCKDANSNELQRNRGKEMHMIEADSCLAIRNPENDASKFGCQKAGSLAEGKQNDTIKAGKKRARPGESGRPRPKDRQQIQDRVRELRDIIPNAAKCSIDALLERTIKYVNDLQTVTQDADKWKQSSKLQTNSNSCIGSGPNGTEGDASWAVELGVGCPIIVEKLKQPRQMLVEMLCEEKGIFLEIADSIRDLGLIILKGIMEARNNKIWARFVVEAVQDVHRLDILCSLMHLLGTNTRSSSNVTNPPCTWRATH